MSACPASSVDGPAPALIIVHGGLDTYCVNRIGAAVREFVSFASDVVVDLASVRTIDSGGVAFIESLHGAITQRGGSLTIHDPNITVERILQICGIDAAIPVCRPT